MKLRVFYQGQELNIEDIRVIVDDSVFYLNKLNLQPFPAKNKIKLKIDSEIYIETR